MIPAITGLSTPRPAQALDQLEVVGGVEEELRDRKVGLAPASRRCGCRSLSRLWRPRVRLRVRGDAHREVADARGRAARARSRGGGRPAGRSRSFGGSPPSARMFSMPASPVAGHDLDELTAGVRGAGEMRHRRHRRVAVDLDDQIVRALAGGAAGAVGDRDIRRRRSGSRSRQRLREQHPPSSRRGEERTRTSNSCRSSGSR